MPYDPNWLAICAKDPRYEPAAYDFVSEALEFTRASQNSERLAQTKHISPHELLEGMRQLAIGQFGLMARTVLAQWGVHSTADFGEIVFNLIDAGFLEKTDEDSRADFENVYEFDEAFSREFKIELDELEA